MKYHESFDEVYLTPEELNQLKENLKKKGKVRFIKRRPEEKGLSWNPKMDTRLGIDIPFNELIVREQGVASIDGEKLHRVWLEDIGYECDDMYFKYKINWIEDYENVLFNPPQEDSDWGLVIGALALVGGLSAAKQVKKEKVVEESSIIP